MKNANEDLTRIFNFLIMSKNPDLPLSNFLLNFLETNTT